MKTSQKIFMGFAGIVIIVAAIFFAVKKIEAPTNKDSNISEVSIATKTAIYEITGSYPQFSQADASFNKKIADTISSDISDFTTAANAMYASYSKINGDSFTKSFKAGDYYFDLKAEVVQSNDNFVSVIIREESFADGAHPAHTIQTFNYDMKKHRELSVVDFVSLADASVDSRAQLISVLAKAAEESTLDTNTQQMMNDGTDPANPDNFSKFTFDRKDLTIYFGEYQVAPYVFGEQSVIIPLSKK